MTDTINSAQVDEDAFDADLLKQLEAAGIDPTDEVQSFLAKFTPVPAEVATKQPTRGVTAGHRALAQLLIKQSPDALRVPEVDDMKKAANVVGRLLAAEGYRLKQREGMFADPNTPDSPARMNIVIWAVKRAEPAK